MPLSSAGDGSDETSRTIRPGETSARCRGEAGKAVSDTPRTDALFQNLEDKRINVFDAQKAIQEHARQLEREIRELERENLEVREVLGKMLDEGIGEHAMRAIAKFALKACRLSDRTLTQK